MTAFTVSGADLAAATGWVDRLTPARPLAPPLAGVLLDVGTLGATLTVYDGDTAASADIEADIIDPGCALVSAHLLAAIARTADKERAVTVTISGKTASVAIGKGAGWELPLLELDLYPQLPQLGTPVGQVDGAALTRALVRVLPAAAVAHEAPLFGGIALSAARGEAGEDVLTIATTDRARLAVAELSWEPAAEFQEMLAGADAVRTAAAASTGAGEPITLYTDGNSLSLSSPRYRVLGRLLTPKSVGQWRRVDAAVANIATTVHLDAEAFRQIITRASVVLDKDEALVIDIEQGGVTVRPAVGGRGRATHSAPVLALSGPTVTVGVIGAYLETALTALDAPRVIVAVPAKRGSPFLLHGADADGTPRADYRHIIAQVRMPASAAAA